MSSSSSAVESTPPPASKASGEGAKDLVPPKRPLSNYMLFGQDQRERIAAENPGLKASEILSLISKEWKALSAEEKKKYDEAAEKAKEKYKEEKEAFLAAGGQFPTSGGDGSTPGSTTLPVSRVRKLITDVDPEALRLSATGSFALTKATELFIKVLVEQAGEESTKAKRKTIMPADISNLIHSNPHLTSLLGEDIPAPAAKEKTKKKATPAKKKKEKVKPVDTAAITSFFSPSGGKSKAAPIAEKKDEE